MTLWQMCNAANARRRASFCKSSTTFVLREIVGDVSGHDFDSEITACFEYARDKTVIDNRGNTIGNPGHNPLPPSPLPELPAGQDVLSNLALGAGLSTPVVLLAAGILLVLVLRR